MHIRDFQLVRQQAFSLSLVACLLVAATLPASLAVQLATVAHWLAALAVALIFFLQGLTLPKSALRDGIRQWRLPVIVLIWNFVGFPLLALLLVWLMGQRLSADLQQGLLLLSLLPTTIASAVNFTAMAQGERQSAIVASVLSNLAAVVVVPVAGAWLIRLQAGLELPLLPLLLKLIVLVILPLVLGQAVNDRHLAALEPLKQRKAILSQVLILMIAFLAFAQSFQSTAWAEIAMASWLWLMVSVALLLCLGSWLVWWHAGRLNVSTAQRVAIFYCGTQKSLATGLPMLTLLTLAAGEAANSATVLLPLMVYHPFQLLLAGLLAEPLRQRVLAEAATVSDSPATDSNGRATVSNGPATHSEGPATDSEGPATHSEGRQ